MAGLMRCLQHPAPYLAWLVFSAVALAIANHMDPYVLAFAGLGALWLCPVVVLAGVIGAVALWRRQQRGRGALVLLLALLGGVPTAVAFRVLSGIHWA